MSCLPCTRKFLVRRKGVRKVLWLFSLCMISTLLFCVLLKPQKQKSFSLFLGGAILGLISASVVVAYYVRYSKLRTHINTLLFWRTVCDGGLALLFTCYAAAGMFEGDNGWADSHSYKDMLEGVRPKQLLLLAMTYQFLTFGSETWFLCNSRDLMKTLTDPFTSDKKNLRQYHLLSWSFSLVMAALVAIPGVAGSWYIGGKGIDRFPVIYLENSGGSFFSYPATVWHVGLFYGPVICIYLYALMVFAKTYEHFKQSKGHVVATLGARLHILAANAVNIIVFLGYWSVYAFAYIMTYALAHETGASKVFYWISLYLAPCKGFCDCLVFAITNDLSSEALSQHPFDGDSNEGEDSEAISRAGLLPQSNKALRDEVLFFATTGIRQATREAARRKNHRRNDPHEIRGSSQSFGSARGSLATASKHEIRINANEIRRSTQVSGLDHYTGTQDDSGITLQRFLDELMVLVAGDKREQELCRNRLSFSGRGGPVFESDNEEALAAELQGRPSTLSSRPTEEVNAGGGDQVDYRLKRAQSGSQALLGSVDTNTNPNDVDNERVPSMLRRELPSTTSRTSLDSSVLRPRAKRSHSSDRRNSDPLNQVRTTSTSTDSLRVPLVSSIDDERGREPSTVGRIEEGKDTFPEEERDDVLFVDFCPEIFAGVREHFGISHDMYIEEWETAAKVKLNEGGASDAFFFYSGGERFIAKSCTRAEMAVLCRIANNYLKYLKDNKDSFLLRILGAHSFKSYNTDFFFFVMENIFKIEATSDLSSVLQERYDIKGSWVNRNCSMPKNGQKVTCRYCNQVYLFKRSRPTKPQRRSSGMISAHRRFSAGRRERGSGGDGSFVGGFVTGFMSRLHGEDPTQLCPERLDRKHSPNLVLKDNDLNYRLRLSKDDTEKTITQLKMDSHFLMSQDLMDYSLLIGVHIENHRVKPSQNSGPNRLSETSALQSQVCRRNAVFIEGPTMFYLGVVDILQEWTLKKRLERLAKIYLLSAEPDGLSAAEPNFYSYRFLQKLMDIFGVGGEIDQEPYIHSLGTVQDVEYEVGGDVV